MVEHKVGATAGEGGGRTEAGPDERSVVVLVVILNEICNN